MTFAELEDTLPWGLHDAYIEQMTIDWTRTELTLAVRVMIGEHQETDQRARVVLSGLNYVVMEPPRGGAQLRPGTGVWIQPVGEVASVEGHPPIPEGCFRQHIFVSDLNAGIYVAARDAKLDWIEAAPQPRRSGGKVYFPGEEMPDPE